MAPDDFRLGGVQVWMPTFLLQRVRYQLQKANESLSRDTVVDGIVASFFGGWLSTACCRA